MAKGKGKGKSASSRSTALAPVAPLAPVAASEGGAVTTAALLAQFRPVRSVILPALNLGVGQPRVLYIKDAMRVSTVKADPKKKGEEAREKPATVCTVADMQTGEEFTLLVPAVMEGNLREAYPQDGYVGKAFLCEKKPKRAGKRYFDFALIEVAIQTTAANE